MGALTAIGTCEVHLLNLKVAEEILERVYHESQGTELEKYLISYCTGLAVIKSKLGCQEQAGFYIKATLKKLSDGLINVYSRGYTYYAIGCAYRFLGNFELSLKMYKEALSFARTTSFYQLEGRALYGLSDLYLKQGKVEESLSSILSSIQLLENIGAEFHLAEAYHQLGLVYLAQKNVKSSVDSFKASIHLFQRMKAPNQVEKVEKVMDDLTNSFVEYSPPA
ncbi:MAG: tetratricopeptide repeat protein [Okeania sp. SIO2G5]|nr:tetratricopeptide repeat protein [Okeania sp. SIO2G5]